MLSVRVGRSSAAYDNTGIRDGWGGDGEMDEGYPSQFHPPPPRAEMGETPDDTIDKWTSIFREEESRPDRKDTGGTADIRCRVERTVLKCEHVKTTTTNTNNNNNNDIVVGWQE